MGGTNGERGGGVVGYGGGTDKHIDELFYEPRGGAVDEDEEVLVVMSRISWLILKLDRSREAFLSLRRLPGLARRYITSGGGKNDKVAGAMTMATSNSYLLSVGGGVRFTVIVTGKKGILKTLRG